MAYPSVILRWVRVKYDREGKYMPGPKTEKQGHKSGLDSRVMSPPGSSWKLMHREMFMIFE